MSIRRPKAIILFTASTAHRHRVPQRMGAVRLMTNFPGTEVDDNNYLTGRCRQNYQRLDFLTQR